MYKNLIRFSIVLYFISLALPIFFCGIRSTTYGFEILLFGWMGIFTLNFAWFANLFYGLALALFILSKKRLAFMISILGAIIALDAFRIEYLYGSDISGTSFPIAIAITSFGLGFYFWLTAIYILPFAIYFSQESINQNHETIQIRESLRSIH
ncbi:MAG: hypothetical protein KBF99_17750 [Leptospiraceae bacterium]|nr:hypothetical protein [Leptospiraceae bacterium]MBK7056016.1 hypothetical protein [Leptospiraceae bacterium]MBP9165029.1 hypothetical protein [Leptospiraceae bacterium]